MSSEMQSPGDEPPGPLPARPPPQAKNPAAPASARDRAMGCLAMGFGVMFFAAAGVTVWSAVGALIHSEWREAAEQLGLAALMLLGSRVLWLAGRGHNVDVLTGENLDVPAAESDAMLQTLERYDRLLTEAPTGDSARAGGTPDPTRDERVQEPADRGHEARMKERGDPG